MNEQITAHLEKFPDAVTEIFAALRRLIYDSVSAEVEETMWARLPSYCAGDRFVRLIPFKDHINIEASAISTHTGRLANYRITPKGMLQIYLNQTIPSEVLSQVFAETLG